MLELYIVGSNLVKTESKDIDIIIITEENKFNYNVIINDIKKGSFNTEEFYKWYGANNLISDKLTKEIGRRYDVQFKNKEWFDSVKEPFLKINNNEELYKIVKKILYKYL